MMFSTDGRFFTLDCAKLPGGRGNGEAIRSFIDLPPEADLVEMFVHQQGRKLLLAATIGPRLHHQRRRGRGDDQGRQARDEREDAGRSGWSARFVEGDSVAAIGENRKL